MAKRCSSTFHRRARAAWRPPPSATIKVVGRRVPGLPLFRPPPFNGVDGKLRGVVVLAYPHPPRLVGDVIHAVRTRLADPQVREVMARDVVGRAGGMPRLAAVLAVADQLSFLASTEITGTPACGQAVVWAAMCWNGASRSGC